MLSASFPFNMFVTTDIPISSFIPGPITNYVVQLVAYNRAGQSEPILQQVFTTQETVEEDTHLLMPPLEIKAMVCTVHEFEIADVKETFISEVGPSTLLQIKPQNYSGNGSHYNIRVNVMKNCLQL